MLNSHKDMSHEILKIYMSVLPVYSSEPIIIKHLNVIKQSKGTNKDVSYNIEKVIMQLKYYDYILGTDSTKEDREVIIHVLSEVFNLKDLDKLLRDYREGTI